MFKLRIALDWTPNTNHTVSCLWAVKVMRLIDGWIDWVIDWLINWLIEEYRDFMLLKEKDGIKQKDLMLKSFPPLKHILKGICYIATICCYTIAWSWIATAIISIVIILIIIFYRHRKSFYQSSSSLLSSCYVYWSSETPARKVVNGLAELCVAPTESVISCWTSDSDRVRPVLVVQRLLIWYLQSIIV